MIDNEKAASATDLKSIPATFEKLSEFANEELSSTFPKSFTDRAMTPEFQSAYASRLQEAIDAGKVNAKKFDPNGLNRFLKSNSSISSNERGMLILRGKMHEAIGNNQYYTGNELTKNLIPGTANNYEAVETFNFQRTPTLFRDLRDADAIVILRNLKPIPEP